MKIKRIDSEWQLYISEVYVVLHVSKGLVQDPEVFANEIDAANCAHNILLENWPWLSDAKNVKPPPQHTSLKAYWKWLQKYLDDHQNDEQELHIYTSDIE